MNLIEKKELTFGNSGLLSNAVASFLMSLLGINKLNKLYQDSSAEHGRELETLILNLGIQGVVSNEGLANIPAKGASIVICNHPTGALDGILILEMLLKVRSDVRIMGNYLLHRIEYLKEYFIAVDPFDSKDRNKNMRGIRSCMKHLEDGGLLVIFPAGEVATWQKGFCGVKDKQWSESIIKFIRHTGVPVIPVCIESRNSALFHLAGKISPMLRTAMLPREMMNKKGCKITITIGSAIIPKRLHTLNDSDYGNFLRANVEYLDRRFIAVPRRKRKSHKPETIVSEIIPATDTVLLENELDSIKSEFMLFKAGYYEVYFTHPGNIPIMMMEIGRQREITYRQIGEGSLNSIDTDVYDKYYWQLFVWNCLEKELVGAYRFGMGDEIVRDYGLEGFYTNSLFKMSQEMLPIMSKTIELGRSFVVHSYQKKTASLMLLWKGILYILLKYEQFDNLLGPVSISGEMDVRSKLIIVYYLRKYHLNSTLTQYINPVTGLDGVDANIDLSLIENIDSLELIGKLVSDIEHDQFSIPILVKKYIQLNSTVLGFNVDHDFSDALDAMMFLELKNVPEERIAMLSKEIEDIDVITRFKEIS